jgi:hypothetical protein
MTATQSLTSAVVNVNMFCLSDNANKIIIIIMFYGSVIYFKHKNKSDNNFWDACYFFGDKASEVHFLLRIFKRLIVLGMG